MGDRPTHKANMDRSSYLKKQPPEKNSQARVIKSPRLKLQPNKLSEERLANFTGEIKQKTMLPSGSQIIARSKRSLKKIENEKKRDAETAALRSANTSPAGKMSRELRQTSMGLSDLGPVDALGNPIDDLLELNKAHKVSKKTLRQKDSNPLSAVSENNSGSKKKIEEKRPP